MQTCPRYGFTRMTNSFGERLKRQRLKLGESQRSLAKKAGVTDPTVTMVENGTRNASRDMVVKLATAADMDIEDALLSAGYLPEGTDEGELVRIPDDAAILIEAYSGATPQNQKLLRKMAEEIREMNASYSIGGKVSGDD